MPPNDDQARTSHIRDAAGKAILYAAGKTRADLDQDEVLRLALTKLVEIVGEAAKQVSPECRQARPDVPWSAAARMRDRLVHHYFDIDIDVLWTTVTDDCRDYSRQWTTRFADERQATTSFLDHPSFSG